MKRRPWLKDDTGAHFIKSTPLYEPNQNKKFFTFNFVLSQNYLISQITSKGVVFSVRCIIYGRRIQ